MNLAHRMNKNEIQALVDRAYDENWLVFIVRLLREGQ